MIHMSKEELEANAKAVAAYYEGKEAEKAAARKRLMEASGVLEPSMISRLTDKAKKLLKADQELRRRKDRK